MKLLFLSFVATCNARMMVPGNFSDKGEVTHWICGGSPLMRGTCHEAKEQLLQVYDLDDFHSKGLDKCYCQPDYLRRRDRAVQLGVAAVDCAATRICDFDNVYLPLLPKDATMKCAFSEEKNVHVAVTIPETDGSMGYLTILETVAIEDLLHLPVQNAKFLDFDIFLPFRINLKLDKEISKKKLTESDIYQTSMAINFAIPEPPFDIMVIVGVEIPAIEAKIKAEAEISFGGHLRMSWDEKPCPGHTRPQRFCLQIAPSSPKGHFAAHFSLTASMKLSFQLMVGNMLSLHANLATSINAGADVGESGGVSCSIKIEATAGARVGLKTFADSIAAEAKLPVSAAVNLVKILKPQGCEPVFDVPDFYTKLADNFSDLLSSNKFEYAFNFPKFTVKYNPNVAQHKYKLLEASGEKVCATGSTIHTLDECKKAVKKLMKDQTLDSALVLPDWTTGSDNLRIDGCYLDTDKQEIVFESNSALSVQPMCTDIERREQKNSRRLESVFDRFENLGKAYVINKDFFVNITHYFYDDTFAQPCEDLCREWDSRPWDSRSCHAIDCCTGFIVNSEQCVLIHSPNPDIEWNNQNDTIPSYLSGFFYRRAVPSSIQRKPHRPVSFLDDVPEFRTGFNEFNGLYLAKTEGGNSDVIELAQYGLDIHWTAQSMNNECLNKRSRLSMYSDFLLHPDADVEGECGSEKVGNFTVIRNNLGDVTGLMLDRNGTYFRRECDEEWNLGECVLIPAGKISCGGHESNSCEACPYGEDGKNHKEAWCNGNCKWDSDTDKCIEGTSDKTD